MTAADVASMHRKVTADGSISSWTSRIHRKQSDLGKASQSTCPRAGLFRWNQPTEHKAHSFEPVTPSYSFFAGGQTCNQQFCDVSTAPSIQKIQSIKQQLPTHCTIFHVAHVQILDGIPGRTEICIRLEESFQLGAVGVLPVALIPANRQLCYMHLRLSGRCSRRAGRDGMVPFRLMSRCANEAQLQGLGP